MTDGSGDDTSPLVTLGATCDRSEVIYHCRRRGRRRRGPGLLFGPEACMKLHTGFAPLVQTNTKSLRLEGRANDVGDARQRTHYDRTAATLGLGS